LLDDRQSEDRVDREGSIPTVRTKQHP